jgi:hypothetical protein
LGRIVTDKVKRVGPSPALLREELSAMYRSFRGRDPDVKPLLEGRGLVGFGEAAE